MTCDSYKYEYDHICQLPKYTHVSVSKDMGMTYVKHEQFLPSLHKGAVECVSFCGFAEHQSEHLRRTV